MSIFDSSIVRQAYIYSYSVSVTSTAGRFIVAFEVDDDDDAFKYTVDDDRNQRCMITNINISILRVYNVTTRLCEVIHIYNDRWEYMYRAW